MSSANEESKVKMQYSSDKNLNARLALHRDFSTNKYGWQKWVFDQYKMKPNSHIAEFGCGNGAVWKANKDRISENVNIILTDLSEGMLSSAREELKDIKQITDFSIMDIQDIAFKDDSFDIVIANHMLYHVPNKDLGISEVARVLKPEGTFYASANSVNYMKEIKELVKNFDSRIDYSIFSAAKEFGLENGAEILSKYFDSVELIVHEDSLHITEAKPLVDYVLSLEGHTNIVDVINGDRINDFYDYVSGIISNKGSIDTLKSAGMFIAKKPKK